MRTRLALICSTSTALCAIMLALMASRVGAQALGPTADLVRCSVLPSQDYLIITRTVTKTREIPPGWVPPTADTLNGVPINTFIVMPPNVIDNVRLIHARGQQLGRSPYAFMKIGDSTIEYPYFFINFDQKRYKLGVYDYLQATIDHFAGYFGRRSAAVKTGQHSWTVMNSAWVNRSDCTRRETPITCELRLSNPSVALIRLGPNDAGNIKLFEKNFRPLIEYLIDQGVIPILSTKADRQPGMIDVNDPIAYQRGHAMQNLTALMALDAVRRVVMSP